MDISFQEIGDEKCHTEVLYGLLKSRVHNISHITIPTIEEHSNFGRSHPYRAWFLVKYQDQFIGSVYLTDQNTIGINIEDEIVLKILPYVIEKIESEFEPLPAIKSVRSANFFINVAPSNTHLIRALESYGCKCSQVSYLVR